MLWERGTELSAALAAVPAEPKVVDLPWIEDRFWVWVHYGATKIARGELFEALGFLGFLREAVLGPLAAVRNGHEPCGVRHLERIAPDDAAALRATVARYDEADAARALLAAVDLYRAWPAGRADLERDEVAAGLALAYVRATLRP